MGEFEKDIRDLFVDLEVEIDTNDLWKGIEKKLDKKRKKFPIWWFLIPVVLLLLTGVFLIGKNNQQTVNKESLVVNNTKSTNTIVNTSTLSTKETTEIVNNTRKSADNNEVEPGKNNNSKLTSSTENRQTQYVQAQEAQYVQAQYVQAQNVQAQKEMSRRTKDSFKAKTPIESQLIKVLLDSDLTNNNFENNIGLNQNSQIRNNSVAKALNDSDKLRKLLLINTIHRSINNLKYKRGILRYNSKIKVNDIIAKTNTNHSWNKSIDFGIGMALATKSLVSKSLRYDYYKRNREKTESHLEAINSNIAFNVQHNSGFFISSGINYTQIDERFLSVDSVYLKSNKNGIVKEIVNADGSITEERGQVEVLEVKNWDKEIYNYYYFIDIPLSLGYSFNIKNTKIEFSSGISYNLAFMKKGQILGVEDYPVDIAKEKNVFKTNSGMNFISNMKIVFPIKNHLFYVEPNIKYNLKSITADNNPLEQKYFNYGIKLGTRFKF